ncbi:MAG: VOC family protein [Actinomycetota bacterium]|nr:VOC family protein [Actinomycetota bacterium]
MSGRIVHFEIPFDDGDRARGFYREAFGWDIQPVPEMDYTMAMSGPTTEEGMPSEPGYINGGMFDRRVGGPATGPVITVDVDSIDAALEKIEKLGGSTLLAKQPIGDMGFAAYFKDTEGNVLGLWESIG